MPQSDENLHVWDWSSCPYAFLVLNQPILDPVRARRLWQEAQIRVLVDGGANQWDCLVREHGWTIDPPDLVTGDFDSIRPDVLETYRRSDKTRVVSTPDQDQTDFTKAVLALASLSGPPVTRALVYVENAGRLDQILANIQTLFQVERLEPKLRVILVSSNSVTFLLKAGRPVAGVVTRGLKWDLDGHMNLAFGQLVSTSNCLAEGAHTIEVNTPDSLLFTMESVPSL